MKDAHEFLEYVRALVAMLPPTDHACNTAAAALEAHNQEVQDICCCADDQEKRTALFEISRLKLCEILESLSDTEETLG